MSSLSVWLTTLSSAAKRESLTIGSSSNILFSSRGKYPSPCMTFQELPKRRSACIPPVAFPASRGVRGFGVVYETGFSSLRRSSEFLTGLMDPVRPLQQELLSRKPEATECRSVALGLAVSDTGARISYTAMA